MFMHLYFQQTKVWIFELFNYCQATGTGTGNGYGDGEMGMKMENGNRKVTIVLGDYSIISGATPSQLLEKEIKIKIEIENT